MKAFCPALPGGQAFKKGPRIPAPGSVPSSLHGPRRDRKCPAEVGVEVIGSWRHQWAETPAPISPLSFHWCLGGATPTAGPQGGREGAEARAEGEGEGAGGGGRGR